jgi:hypothetical protein
VPHENGSNNQEAGRKTSVNRESKSVREVPQFARWTKNRTNSSFGFKHAFNSEVSMVIPFESTAKRKASSEILTDRGMVSRNEKRPGWCSAFNGGSEVIIRR